MNKELGRRVLGHIRNHPDQHNQKDYISYSRMGGSYITQERYDGMDWSCGTTACIAGWAAILSGWRPMLMTRWMTLSPNFVVKDGEEGRVEEVARRELGLDDDSIFFEMDNNEAIRMLSEAVNGE